MAGMERAWLGNVPLMRYERHFGDGADAQGCEQHHGEGDAIAEQDGDPVALGDAGCPETGRT